ncbi:hypothetical protein MTO96_043744, partial [Rhipicephalus appendiculatus]
MVSTALQWLPAAVLLHVVSVDATSSTVLHEGHQYLARSYNSRNELAVFCYPGEPASYLSLFKVRLRRVQARARKLHALRGSRRGVGAVAVRIARRQLGPAASVETLHHLAVGVSAALHRRRVRRRIPVRAG